MSYDTFMQPLEEAHPPGTALRLWVMMFLEFFIWGAWLPLIFGYLPGLGFTAGQQSSILNAFPIAAIVAIFFSNQFADRHFAAERFLAFSHLVGGLAILALGWAHEFYWFATLMWIHCLFYVPTISITNSIAFAAMKDAQREFGLIRMGGTIGWIAAAWPFVFILADWTRIPAFGSVPFTEWLGTALGAGKSGSELLAGTRFTFVAAGIASLLLAAFSLSLPHTPPKRDATGEKLALIKALQALATPSMLILWLVTMVDATVHQSYFNWTGRFLQHIGIAENWVMPVMSIGQIAEIITMAFLGYCLQRLGWRATMIIGVLGHAARFAVFAFVQQPLPVVLVIALHGICYAFFFATVYIFVDEFMPKDVRASAQGLFNLMILGIGPLIANSAAPRMYEHYVTKEAADYRTLFLIPCLSALAAAAALALFFHPPRQAGSTESALGA